MSEVKRFNAPGPWITRELRPCVLATDYDALQSQVGALRAALRLARAELVEAGIDNNCNYNETLAGIDASLPPATGEKS